MLGSIPRGLAVAGLTAAALAVPMTGAATAAPHGNGHTVMCHTHSRCHHTQGRHHGHGGSNERRRDHVRHDDDDFGRRGEHRRYDDDDNGRGGDERRGGDDRRAGDDRRGGDDERRGGDDERRSGDRGRQEDAAASLEGNGLGRDGLLGLGVLGLL
ncbi:hypothetical protein GCM10010211_27790 [Streptomyces albospinus]|uniref:Uncharacterized protein n=1 Tax=Streptomyces albospinus TaxID=285515 RepID=A0ABQ2V0K2_9ACTN|nr:hypothetical protein [Streptomyces albospinus]GGU61277.1 hypothetical protein GCM10010211_27790 [Streptomyces albospinus]